MHDILSINVGMPKEVRDGKRVVRTGIFKEPVVGARRLGTTQLEGDGQADLVDHGGESKAAYVYSADHYAHWQRELDRPLPFGQFGENFTVQGLTEDQVHIGDVFRAGGARVEVTQPRVPCFKLGIRMGDPGFVGVFLKSLRTGFYLRVLEEGPLAAGDRFEPEREGPGAVTVARAMRLLFFEKNDLDGARQVLAVPALSPEWRREFEKRVG
jgi:MOSC domain-containing protein YiiM